MSTPTFNPAAFSIAGGGNPSSVLPYSGIYRCEGCGHEIVGKKERKFPSQNQAQHSLANGPIEWHLVVAAAEKKLKHEIVFLCIVRRICYHLPVTSIVARERMYFYGATLDDLVHRVLEKLLVCTNRIHPTRGGATELTGVLLKLKQPRARLSRTEKKGHVFSPLGELLWYLSKRNDLNFIQYYVERYAKESDDGVTVHGGYGPRLFNKKRNHQVANVLKLLRESPYSRRAVIQLFGAADLDKRFKEIPCTCTLQFMIRKKKLHLFVNMRSNDAFFGLPHDIFAFTMLQEIFAVTLGVELGEYKQSVGSLHLYDDQRKRAQAYVNEGWQEEILMPAVPTGDPWPALAVLLEAETVIRNGKKFEVGKVDLPSYWKDLIRLLLIYRAFKDGDTRMITGTKRSMSIRIYDPYIDAKRISVARRLERSEAEQPDLFSPK